VEWFSINRDIFRVSKIRVILFNLMKKIIIDKRIVTVKGRLADPHRRDIHY